MFIKRSLLLILSLSALVQAQIAPEPRALVPGQPVESPIAGGENHTYQIKLTAGEFVRFRLEQRSIDLALVLAAPDGKQLFQMNLTRAGDEESLSLEAAVNGDYSLTVRAGGVTAVRGSYNLEAATRVAATEQDRKRMSAEALMIEADVLSAQGGKTSAQVIDKEQQAIAIWRELGEVSWAAYALYMTGYAYYDLSQFGKAAEYFEQSRVGYRDARDRAGEGSALNALGNAYAYISRDDKGTEYYEQALAIRREVNDRTGEGSTLSNLANIYLSTGRYDKAIDTYEQALAIAREVKDRTAESNALHGLGASYEAMGSYEKGMAYQEQVLSIAREIKNRAAEGNALTDLGNISFAQGDYQRSIAYHEQVLAIRRDMKDRLREASALLNLGNVYVALGRFEKGIEYFEQALAIYREVKNRSREGAALNNLGLTYSFLGRYDKAIDVYRQALVITREVKDRPGEGKTLNNLGFANLRLGRYDKAIELSEQALAIAREVKNLLGQAGSLANLGNISLEQRNFQKAIEYHEQSLAIYREIGSRAGAGTALSNLADAYLNLKEYDKAIDAYGQSLAIRHDTGDTAGEAYVLANWAQAERAKGDLAAARAHIEKSLEISESLRADLVSPESRSSYLATAQGAYHLYTNILMGQHQAEPTKGFDALALEVSERQRARSLLDLLTESHADLAQGVDPTLIDRERSLGRQLNTKAQLLTQADKPEQATALKQQISQLENDYERAQASIRKASPHYAALTQPQPLKLKEIQAQLDPDTLLLEYALGDERSYLWAITKDSLASYELPKGELIEKGARQVYQLLTARSARALAETDAQRQTRISQAENQLPVVARDLSQIVLAPVAAQLGGKRLVIVADGALQYIPFAMLPDPVSVAGRGSAAKNIGQPLVVSHEVISLPSASALAIQRNELSGRQPAPKTLAVIADPVFDRTDPRFRASATTDQEDKANPTVLTEADSRTLEHIAHAADDKSGRLVIQRLPFTRQEADALLSLAPQASSLREVDFQANRTNVMNGDLAQYRYIHFATHGLLDSERPGLSALVLSTVDESGNPRDGFLRANDIYNMKLPAELVVLSACQTGLGKEVKGEGLIGLTRGFMYAGAKRVVVSLWSVNDKATSDLMTKFYRGMLKDNERPADALRAAQIEMWKQKKWQSPYYWAAFTMQGEWR